MHEILGQAQAVDRLIAALAAERAHHAYVFHGPHGVGKFTTAWAFARTMLCHDRQVGLTGRISACRACASCRLLSEGQAGGGAHPDLHVVTKELARYSDEATIRALKLRTIPVSIVRDNVIEPVHRAPQMGSGKVFVIDEAELLASTSQNTLLKALEEPPPETYLILVTANAERLLPTVRSRCQPIAFVPLSDAIVEQWVQKIAPELDTAQLDWLVGFAAGSLGQAQLAVEYDLFEWARTVLPALAQMTERTYPAALGADMAERIDGFAKRWVDAHKGASKEAANQQAASLMWRIISQHVRKRIIEVSSTCDPADPIDAEHRLAGWLDVIDAIAAAEANLARNVNLSLVADHLVAKMYHALAGAPLSEKRSSAQTIG
jgi:DNA polymerase-3 subunit delta'